MIVGIDLGTTHSLIGYWSTDGAKLVPNALGELLTPSVVGITDDDEILVGRAALEQLRLRPDRAVAGFKRYMGSARETQLGKRSFRCEELSALVLKSLIADVAAQTGSVPDEAIISVPAYFSDAQRKATRNAAQIAGLNVERLVNEPSAAALAYGLQQVADESRFLVLDLGGGTFDVSLLETYEGVMEVRASAGDNFLGGEDFVDLLQTTALRDLSIDETRLTNTDRAKLRATIEQAKQRLSQHSAIEVALDLASSQQVWRIEAERFEQLAAPLLARLRGPIERALRDSSTRPDQLDQIVLVGGASRMPMVSRLVTRLFGRLPLRHMHPDQAIAIGACAAAGMKQRAEAFREVVMTDVCPYSLGVETVRLDLMSSGAEGMFMPVIERNSVIPTSRVERFFPLQDGQRHLTLKVYQGESPRVASNIFLGKLEVPLPGVASAACPVDVRFTYDSNGLLDVEAHVTASDVRHRLVIEQNPGLLSATEIHDRLNALAGLKVHPREQQANVAVLARLERLYEEHLGPVREQLGHWLLQFRHVLERQEPQGIEQARSMLLKQMDLLESGGLLP
jgi:molecular chaperone HscC